MLNGSILSLQFVSSTFNSLKLKSMKPFHLLLMLLFWISCSSESSTEQNNLGIELATNENIETLYIIYHFADYPVMTPHPGPYIQRIDSLLQPMAKHPAVEMVSRLIDQGFYMDYSVNWLFQYSALPAFEKNRTIDYPFASRVIPADSLEKFAHLMRDFYVEGKLSRFFESEATSFQAMKQLVQDSLSAVNLKKELQEFYGDDKEVKMEIVLSPQLHSGGFAVLRTDSLSFYAVIGPDGLQNGIPQFSRSYFEQDLVLHEFGHNYANPVIDLYKKEIDALESFYYPLLKSSGEEEGYSNWHSLFTELTVRATTLYLVRKSYGDEEANELLEYERSIGFGFLEDWAKVFENYQNQRDTYPNFKSYFPEFIRFLKDYRLSSQSGKFE